MAMAEGLTWRPLPLASSHDLPVLLVAVGIGPARYTIRLTDMANVWVEKLDRKAICMRAWSENATIDPSDTPENMAKLLASLRSALDPSQPGHDETSLTLTPAPAKEVGEDGLTLRILCPLPGLPPLKWPVHLTKSPASAVATDLVLPLVEGHYCRRLEVETLTDLLAHKDTVIAKLADKLEATGTGLEHVFTGLSGKRKVTRALAGERIKGLAPWEPVKWRANLLRESQDRPTSARDVVQQVFDGDGLGAESLMAPADASPALDTWWRHEFKGTSRLVPRHGQSLSRQASTLVSRTAAGSAEADEDNDDEFEIQATPPHLRPGKGDDGVASSAPVLDDASTEGEDEDEGEDQDAIQAPAGDSDGKTKPLPRVGVVGGKTPALASPSIEPEHEHEHTNAGKTETAEPGEDTETASEAETASVHEDEAVAPAPPAPSWPSDSPARKGGLGRIGGQAGDRQPAPATATATTTSGIGKIGGVAAAQRPDPRGTLVVERGRAPAPEETGVEERRETSQERADRRREELKRELERKASAGPTKKKRRF